MSKINQIISKFFKEYKETVDLKNLSSFQDYDSDEIANIETAVHTVFAVTDDILNYHGTDVKMLSNMVKKVVDVTDTLDNYFVVEGDDYDVSKNLSILDTMYNKELPNYFNEIFDKLTDLTEEVFQYLGNRKYFNNLNASQKKIADEMKEDVGMVDGLVKSLMKDSFYLGSYKYLDTLKEILNKIVDNKDILSSLSVDKKIINGILECNKVIQNPKDFLNDTLFENIKTLIKEIKSGLVQELKYHQSQG